MTYDELSIAQKAGIIKACVQQGIYDPTDIRTAYNRFAEGKDIYGEGGLLHPDVLQQKAEKFGMFIRKGSEKTNKYEYGGLYVDFPDYMVDTGMGFKAPLGHGMVIAVDRNTGKTRGSEYGRYDKANRGIARRVKVPDLQAVDPSNPTAEELNLYAKSLDKAYGHSGGTTKVYFVKDADESKMIGLMESAERNQPDSFYQNRAYKILDHNCGTYGADMIKKSMPLLGISGFGAYTFGTPSSIAPVGKPMGIFSRNK